MACQFQDIENNRFETFKFIQFVRNTSTTSTTTTTTTTITVTLDCWIKGMLDQQDSTILTMSWCISTTYVMIQQVVHKQLV